MKGATVAATKVMARTVITVFSAKSETNCQKLEQAVIRWVQFDQFIKGPGQFLAGADGAWGLNSPLRYSHGGLSSARHCQSPDSIQAMNAAAVPEASHPASELASGPASSKKGQILAWASWDWGSAAFNAIMTTFVFTVYLTSSAFGGEDAASAALGAALAVAGLAIALLAPVTGQRSDAGGRRKLWLGV